MEVERTRRLLRHDRKLENAVTKSVIEMLAREGLDLRWRMEGHRLMGATVAPRRAVHLGGLRLDGNEIAEDLHGEAFAAMAAALFGGTAVPSGGAGKPEKPPRPSRATGKNRPAAGGKRRSRRGFRGSRQ